MSCEKPSSVSDRASTTRIHGVPREEGVYTYATAGQTQQRTRLVWPHGVSRRLPRGAQQGEVVAMVDDGYGLSAARLELDAGRLETEQVPGIPLVAFFFGSLLSLGVWAVVGWAAWMLFAV